MACELCHAGWYAPDHLHQVLDAHSAGKRRSGSGLAVEVAAVPDRRRTVAQRDPEPAGDGLQDAGNGFVEVDVLMRIEVRWLASDQAAECVQLRLNFDANPLGVGEI